MVWNMWIMTFPSYLKCHHPNWRTHSIIFQRGRAKNHQPDLFEAFFSTCCLRIGFPRIPLKTPILQVSWSKGFSDQLGDHGPGQTRRLGSFWGEKTRSFKAISPCLSHINICIDMVYIEIWIHHQTSIIIIIIRYYFNAHVIMSYIHVWYLIICSPDTNLQSWHSAQSRGATFFGGDKRYVMAYG